VLLEEITDVSARAICGRSYHATATTLEHVLNNWDIFFDQLSELGAPIKRAAPATGMLLFALLLLLFAGTF
jgi:hypothetical protein